jgi:hypothetical protein
MTSAFQRFTNPTTASEILRSCLPELAGDPREITGCRMQDARLKTFTKVASKIKSTMSVCYQLTVHTPSTSQSSHHLVYLKAYLHGRSAEVFLSLSRNRPADQTLDQAVTHVPQYDAIIWRFPHDPALPHLPHVINLQTIEQHLPLDGLNLMGMSGTPHVMASHVVNYRPETRCTNRYDLFDPSCGRAYRLFGKTFHGSEGQSLYTRLQHFWERSLIDPGAMAVAQPLGYAAPIKTVWQLGVPGVPLLQELTPSTYEPYVTELVRGLASLHHSNVTGLQTHSVTDHLAEVRKKLTKLSDAIPSLTETCLAMADDLEHTAPPSSVIPCRPIHWDFHVQQVLADKGRLVFCDLDELVYGDPVQDLANFIVDLHFHNLNEQFVERIARNLYHAYRRQVEWDVPVERVTWHARLQFINKAYRHYLRFAPGFERTVEQILALAQKGFSL